jgi:hypothetical protein
MPRPRRPVRAAQALPATPYDGHTLRAVIEATERLTGRDIERSYVDKGYRGHDTANPRRVLISGQKRAWLPKSHRAPDRLRKPTLAPKWLLNGRLRPAFEVITYLYEPW